MSDIAAIGGSGAGRLDPVNEAAPRVAIDRPAPGRVERPSDRVELSDRARLLSKLSQLPAVRQDLIDQVRRQIEAGEYDTPGRLDAALDGLVDDLDITA
ncbi:MAG: flagellar biosynthesis anti-sigma factor FlgM [Phycisphaeraceae bacterium]|nr:flagellar biosynthesis anti-sigma factor FlgM [Phycisphaeraceae bacterium]